MIDFIKGKLIELTPTRAVVECNGIGYGLEISLQTYSKLENRQDVCIYVQIQSNPREGTTVEYGFADKEERELFRLITSVSGMGSSSARMMLSSLSGEEFRNAILGEDINKIKSVKGIGLKSAQRLILELKDKISKGEGFGGESVLFGSTSSAEVEEASTALMMLGFSKPNVNKAIQTILKKSPSAKVEEIVKAALKML